MSTKIYDAFRIPVSQLPRFISGYRRIMFRGAVRGVKELMAIQDPVKSVNGNLICQDKKSRDEIMAKEGWQKRVSLTMVFALLMVESESGQNGLNYDSSFNVWLEDDLAYIIPYPGNFYGKSKAVDRLVRSLGGREYRYWNNSDIPKGVTEQEWARRWNTWTRICLDDWNAGRLSHVVIEGKRLHNNGFEEIEKTILGKGNLYMTSLNAIGVKDRIKKMERKIKNPPGCLVACL